MSAASEARRILIEFGKDTSEDLETSLIKALRDGGNRNPQNPALNFREDVKINGSSVVLEILASGEYWKWIESGRKIRERKIPADVVGEKWQKTNGIDARVVLLNITARAISKKSGVAYKERRFKYAKKTLKYEASTKTLSYIIQQSIYKKGIKPKPFVDRVIDDGRIEVLAARLKEVLGPLFKLEIISDIT